MSDEKIKSEAAKREEDILAFWEKQRIFEKSLKKPAPKGDYIVYEGPPTANGRPGIHHLESRAFKDAFPRYKTMRGYHVARRAGWDTHGLPVELEVEKELEFKGKPDIEKYGVGAFNKKCRESVLKYISEWNRFTKRMGYWVDQEKAYFTFDAPYMESVWSVVKKVSDDGRLYKDYKVLPWCARCGTALSSHELAQGYEDVKDLSVTVEFRVVGEPNTSFLAWTTTPWTLPGNVALAVGSDITYAVVEKENDDGSVARFILAKERVEAVFGTETHAIVEEKKGKELVGLKYEPLYDFLPSLANESEKPKFAKAYQVYPADFVNTTEGTGVVHTAVMYGADDFTLGTAVGLPKVHAVGADGKFIKGAGFLEGRFVKDEDVAVDIIKDLAGRTPTSHLFSKEKYEHSYPFCWRCKTPLIYYARDSWYIRMEDLRGTLLAENAKVNWEPAHIRDGRMGEWLANAKDWALSRERYWGTPLPVWEAEDGTDRIVIGSVEELKKYSKKSGNKYFVMRHGEAEHNVADTLNSKDRDKFHLTEVGRAQAEKAGDTFKKEGVTKVFASPFRRAQETACIIAKKLGLPELAIHTDERLREFEFGELDGAGYQAFLSYRSEHMSSVDDRLPGGESYQDARKRFGEFLYELEQTYTNETIAVIAHGIMFESLQTAAQGTNKKDAWQMILGMHAKRGEYVMLPFVPLPHNEDYELDLHRPYIDAVVLIKDGKEYHRVKEVMDVWLDPGSMPFAQDHYPFENKEWVEGKGYPADYISEGLDQTRGWFYTLLAVGVLLGRGRAFKNVICLGLLLDAQGKKMSKSKGNVVEPFEAMEKYGADTLRFWMYYVNQAGDSKNFDEKTVKEAGRVLGWLENSAKFYGLFKTDEGGEGKEHVIDRWMRARTNQTVATITKAMDEYHPYEATRAVAGLIEDLSQWYVRRIRDRARGGDTVALRTLQETLRTCSLLMAPFSPFIAEWVFRVVRTDKDPESVHLATWPEGGDVDEALINDMGKVRSLASEALMQRQQAGIKVSSVLGSFSTTESFSRFQELTTLLAEEINVQVIIQGQEKNQLDTKQTPEHVALTDERVFQRAVAEARKGMRLSPKDKVTITRGGGEHSVKLSTGVKRFDIKVDAS